MPALLCLLVSATLTPLTSAEAATPRNALSPKTLRSMSITAEDSFQRGIADLAHAERSNAPMSPVRLDTVLDEGNSATRPQCHQSDVHVATTYEAMCWSEVDDETAQWYPQGITGSGDASSSNHLWAACQGCPQRQVVAVSWHHKTNKLARVSFMDVTEGRVGARYNHVTLVEPNRTAQRFRRIQSHADGIAWYGNMLYLVSSGTRAIRVFDLRHIFRMTSGAKKVGCGAGVCSAAGAPFALPQIGTYTFPSGRPCERRTGTRPCFSSVSVDRSTNPDSLVTAEYTTYQRGRILRWPLDISTGKLRVAKGKSWIHPFEGWASPVRRMQGVTLYGNRGVVAGLCPEGAPVVSYMNGGGAALYDRHAKACLYEVNVSPGRTVLGMRYWTTVPANTQNVSYWPSTGTLWTVSEFRGDGVFASDRLLLAFDCPSLTCS